MDAEILKATSTKVALLTSAATPDEAEAVLKQIIANLGYDATVTQVGDDHQRLSQSEMLVNPSAAPSWSIVLREGGASPAGSPSERESLARIACEVFGLVVTRLETASRIDSLCERIGSAVGTLHHDIRTPLTSIAGMAQTLKMRPSLNEDVQSEFLERMEVAAETITSMTDEFRAGLEAGLSIAALPAEAVRLEEVFAKAIDEIRSRGIDVTTVIEPDRPLVVRAPSGVIAAILTDVMAHLASVLTGKAVAGIREEEAGRTGGAAGGRTIRVFAKGPTAAQYAIPVDLPKTWVPEGTLVSDEQVERLSRPYHLIRALGGSFEISEEGGEVVLEILLPLSG